MMRSTFFGLELGKRALITERLGTDVVGHNLANANTPGYSRQRPEFASTEPYAPPGTAPYAMSGQVGTGVTSQTISRAQNEFLANQGRVIGTRQARLTTLQGTYTQLQGIFSEPSTQSLDSLLTDFFAKWHDLSLQPEETANRTALREAATTTVSEFHRINEVLDDQQKALDAQVERMVGQVNEIGQELATLNNRIQRVTGTGQAPNDLMDRRDQLVSDLNTLVKAEVAIQPDNTALVTVAGRVFVQSKEFRGLSTVVDWTNQGFHRVVYSDLSTVDIPVIGGQLMATLEARDDIIPGFRKTLDTLAQNLVTEVNQVHQVGYGLDGQTGRDFFAGADAATIDLAAPIQQDARFIGAAMTNAPGDGTNALAIAQLEQAGVLGLSNTTFNAYYRGAISELGAAADGVDRAVSGQQQLKSQIDTMRESEIGVNMDEELVNLIKYQQGYSAASRFITTVDDTLDRLINRTGRVGLG